MIYTTQNNVKNEVDKLSNFAVSSKNYVVKSVRL